LVHQGEDSGVGADAECERENGDGGKQWCAPDGAQGEAQVLKKITHSPNTDDAAFSY
jgi:hypothetical protein